MQNYIKSMRPHQWFKNLLVFSGVFFGHKWNEASFLIQSFLLFMSFSCVASAIYIINDYFDCESDKSHPIKKNRPLACGAIKVAPALTLAAVLLILGFLLIIPTGSVLAFIFIGLYTLMNLAYSKFLKHILILDVVVLSGSYILRILVGTDGIGIEMSSWLLLCGMAVTMMMGFGKRYAEKKVHRQEIQRTVVKKYDEIFLLIAVSICAAIFLVFYGLYTLDLASTAQHGRRLILTYPWIIIGIFRYLQLLISQQKNTEDPASLLLSDLLLFFIFSGWIITFLLVSHYGKI